MKWSDLRRPAVVRDLLIAMYAPTGGGFYTGCKHVDPTGSVRLEYIDTALLAGTQVTDGAIDGCSASGRVLELCRRMGYASPYGDRANYCTITPVTNVPQHCRAEIVRDHDGVDWRVCTYRMTAWKPGRPIPVRTRRIGAVYTTRDIRTWLRNECASLLLSDTPHAATLRGLMFDDWADVDSDPAAARWLVAENTRRQRRDLTHDVMTAEEQVSAWRVERQWQLCRELGRRMSVQRPWERRRACATATSTGAGATSARRSTDAR